MSRFHKIPLAADMFVEAHARYESAKRELDYVVSLLLSGAVVGIVAPLLTEQHGHSTHEVLARLGNFISEPGDERMHEGMFRDAYNALKHSGNKRAKVAAADDLMVDANLKLEAARMLDAAKSDFRNIEVPEEVQIALSPEFIALLESNDSYA